MMKGSMGGLRRSPGGRPRRATAERGPAYYLNDVKVKSMPVR